MPKTETSSVPLESGDRLTRAEFHRRYCARPDIKKAELIQGVVYVASPTRVTVHGNQHLALATWLGVYAAGRPGIMAADNATVFLDPESEVQPDVMLYRESGSGGSAHLTDNGYMQGAPELVGEVAASSASYDLHDKMDAYRRAGVREYIVWRVLDEQIDWFRLRDGLYVRVEPDDRGIIESEVFPGLRLAVAKMLAGDIAGVLDELTTGR